MKAMRWSTIAQRTLRLIGLGAVALGAKFRMLLLLDYLDLRELADDAFRQVDAILSAADKAEVEALDAKFESHMSVFVATAANLLAIGEQ